MFDNVFDVMIKLLMPSVYHVQLWIFSKVRWSFLSSLYLKLVWLRFCLYAVNLRHQRPGRQTRTVPSGFVIALVCNGAVAW